jgi:hypothetical protein
MSERADLRARLEREYAIVPGRDELPAISYRDGFALLDMLAAIEALVTGDRPPAPFTDVAEEAMWHVGYTACQADVLAALHPAPSEAP